MATSEIFGVLHLTKLTIVIEGKQIKHYKHFQLSQSVVGHHSFSLVLDNESLGNPEDHQLEQAQKLLGKHILVIFSYKDISDGPERDFIGVITKVGLGRENKNTGNILLTGYSPTILLDKAPHIQSFGGNVPVSLNTIANTVLEQCLNSKKYKIKVDAQYENVSYSCQYDETHYNYLARIAESYGEQFFYDGKSIYFGKLPLPEKAIRLVFGKHIDKVEISMKVLHISSSYYGYNSSDHQNLNTGKSEVKHVSSLGKAAHSISKNTLTAPSLGIAPIKIRTSKDLDVAQGSTIGSRSVDVFTVTGITSVPFLYPGCVVDMEMLKPGTRKTTYFTRLMITDVSHSVDKLGNYEGYFKAIGADTGFLPKPNFDVPKAESQFATVISNADELNQGRVQVRFDWQGSGDNTEWIRVMSPDAGSSDKVNKNRGFVFIPEVGDQVMVGFVHSHPDRPYVMGGLFHGKIANGGGKDNNIKSLSSKSGNRLELNDEKGSVYLTDQEGVNMKFDGGGNATINAISNHTVNTGSTHIINVGGKEEDPPQSFLKMDDSGNIILNGKTSISFQVGGNKIAISKEGIVTTVAEGKIEGIAEKGPIRIESKSAEVTFMGSKAITVQGGDVAIDGKSSIKISSSDTDIT